MSKGIRARCAMRNHHGYKRGMTDTRTSRVRDGAVFLRFLWITAYFPAGPPYCIAAPRAAGKLYSVKGRVMMFE